MISLSCERPGFCISSEFLAESHRQFPSYLLVRKSPPSAFPSTPSPRRQTSTQLLLDRVRHFGLSDIHVFFCLLLCQDSRTTQEKKKRKKTLEEVYESVNIAYLPAQHEPDFAERLFDDFGFSKVRS